MYGDVDDDEITNEFVDESNGAKIFTVDLCFCFCLFIFVRNDYSFKTVSKLNQIKRNVVWTKTIMNCKEETHQANVL